MQYGSCWEHSNWGQSRNAKKQNKTLYLEKPQSYVFYMKYILGYVLAFQDVQQCACGSHGITQ